MSHGSHAFPARAATLRAALLPSLVCAVLLAACSARVEDSPAYQAACHGPQLRSAEQLNKAMEDGYDINREFSCIDKASFASVNAEKARWAAANTPEAIALREAEYKRQAEEQRAQAAARRADSAETLASSPAVPLTRVDANSASESELAGVPSIGSSVAAQIIAERDKRPFSGWPDLVNRVSGLSQARSAVFASVCGLTVAGESLPGAPFDPVLAARYQASLQEPRQLRQ